ncbi:flippase-like domain-containing protein [Helcobacillus massiliensis]|uniref:Uncharacterized membrane protein YbhN (UPF0104 family) n=1 Tax=Helcobacillus massiliensis TaxID=521392 RepID=A0A839QSM6_9MICO|nr:flippase-like domain-containing protein [Helcobacillus massiliensis]MBB3023042.1 uncharacterized membrane protein YbhN (UPF0104 family) [Helcobacillus massiliensis]
MTEPDVTARPPLWRVVVAVLSLALTALIVLVLIPRAARSGWPEILSSLTSTSPLWVGALLVVAALAALIDTAGFRRCFPGVAFGPALRTNTAAGALSAVVPLGSTLAVTLIVTRMRTAGLRRSVIAAGTAVASAADILTSIALPVIGAALLATSARITGGTAAALAVGAVLGLVLLAAVGALAVNRRVVAALLKRAQGIEQGFSEGFGRSSVDFTADGAAMHDESLRIARAGGGAAVWLPLLARILQAAAFAALCTSAFGLDVTVLEAAAVFALGRLLTLVPLTPSGLGVVETGMTGALVALGADASGAAAAVLLMTITQTLFPAAVGALLLPTGAGPARE